MKATKLFLVSVFALLFFVGCEEYTNETGYEIVNPSQGVSSNILDFVGLDHNLFLEHHIYDDTVWNQSKWEGYFNIWLDTCSTLNGNYPPSDSIEYSLPPIGLDFENFIDTSGINSEVKDYLIEIRDVFSNSLLSNQNRIYELEIIEQSIINNNTADTLEIYIALASVSVAINSLNFWLNHTQQQRIDFSIKKFGNKQNIQIFDWFDDDDVNRVANADADGAIWAAVTFFVTPAGGAAAAAGPAVFFGAFAGTVLVGAAQSSVRSATTGN